MVSSGEAPVPPLWPAIQTISAPALTMPAATMAAPETETIFTAIRAAGLSWRSL